MLRPRLARYTQQVPGPNHPNPNREPNQVHGQLALVSCKDGRLHVQTGHGAATTYSLGEEAL